MIICFLKCRLQSIKSIKFLTVPLKCSNWSYSTMGKSPMGNHNGQVLVIPSNLFDTFSCRPPLAAKSEKRRSNLHWCSLIVTSKIFQTKRKVKIWVFRLQVVTATFAKFQVWILRGTHPKINEVIQKEAHNSQRPRSDPLNNFCQNSMVHQQSSNYEEWIIKLRQKFVIK